MSPEPAIAQPEIPIADLLSLEGRVAVVTGAAQGFGFACARHLAGVGARVLLADLRQDSLERAVVQLTKAGADVATTVADVACEDDAQRVVDEAVACFGRVDVLVNNAGVFSNVLLPALELAEFERILAVNVGGTFLCTKAAAAQMRRQRSGGAIVNISSIDAVHPSGSGLSHYGTSKHAIWGFTKAMALELGPDGIRVNAIAPGPSLTEGALAFVRAGASDGIDVEAQWDAYEERIPLRRLLEPDEVGRACVFLASDLASYVNGAQLVVDGGLLAA